MTTLFQLSLRRIIAASMAAVLLAAFSPAAGVRAAEPALPTADILPDAPAPALPPKDPAVQAHLPGCAVWTDRCVTCERASGRTSCSNTGIACQPEALQCLRSEAAADTGEPKKDAAGN